MQIESKIAHTVAELIKELTGQEVNRQQIVLQKTRREFDGDLTLVVFPFVKMMRKSPEETAKTLGNAIRERVEEVTDFQVVKGFLNLGLSDAFWKRFLAAQVRQEERM